MLAKDIVKGAKEYVVSVIRMDAQGNYWKAPEEDSRHTQGLKALNRAVDICDEFTEEDYTFFNLYRNRSDDGTVEIFEVHNNQGKALLIVQIAKVY